MRLQEKHLQIKWVPMVMILVIGVIFSITAFSDDIVTPILVEEPGFSPPVWLKPVVDMIIGLPYVGPILVEAFKWVGVVAASMTAIAAGFAAIAKSLQAIARGAGFIALSLKIKDYYDKIYPILAWLSIFNAPKRVRK